MEINIFTEEYEVIKSGTVLNAGSLDKITLEVSMSENFKFSIAICFAEDDTKEKNLTVKIDNEKIVFTCTNFNNSVGTGLNRPIEIAQLSGKKVYFCFWVYALNEKSNKRIDYTFFKEK